MIWKIEKRNINDLKSYEKNPRKFTKKGLADLKESIKNCGDANIITINADNTVLGGHARLKVMKQLGFKEVDVKVPDELLNEQQVKEIVVRLNANNAGDWDIAKLNTFFDKDYLKDWGLDIDLGLNLNKNEVQEVEVPEKPKARCKQGQVWKLGKHRLMCGDSTSITDVEKLMNGEKANMVFTDPPYLMGFEGNVHADGSKSFNAKHGAIKNDKMSRENGDSFILNIFKNIKLFSKGAYYVCFYRLGLDYIFRALDKLNNPYKALIIWNKGNHTLSNSDYMSKYEPIVYGWFNEHNFYGDRSNFDIWDVERTKKNDLHPTMKPIKLIEKAVLNSSKSNEIVLDLFGGSGSTLIACEQLNRKCFMMELDEHYCDIIIERWEKLTGLTATVI